MLLRLLPFKHRIRIEPRGKYVVAYVDGQKLVFRSKLFQDVEPIDISRVALWKRYGSLRRKREEALRWLKSQIRSYPRRVYRLVKRLLKIRKAGRFRRSLRELLRIIRYSLPSRPKRAYRRKFRSEMYELAGEYVRMLGEPWDFYRVRFETIEAFWERLERAKRRWEDVELLDELDAVYFHNGKELRVRRGTEYVVFER